MPLLIHQYFSAQELLAVWHITETMDELRNLLGTNYHEQKMEIKLQQAVARHFLASRILLTQLFPASDIVLYKDIYNKPHLEIDGIPHGLSITHSHDMAGIYIAKEGNPGLDLERRDQRISRVKHKFLNPEEFIFAGADHQIWEQTLIWSAKETLYKVYGNKELDFKEHLSIQPFQKIPSGNTKGIIHKGDFQQELQVHYQEIDQYILTYTIQQ